MTYRVLITDDEERMRRVLAMVFDEMKDIKVVTVSDCVTTLEYLERERFHLLITDLKVPEVGRLDFLKAIKCKARSSSNCSYRIRFCRICYRCHERRCF